MNIAQMMNRRNSRENPEKMPIQQIQEGFRKLNENQLNEMVQMARSQGISEMQINEGLQMIRGLKM